jgi:hypothetical protein
VSQDVVEDVVGFEGRAGWSFGVEFEVVFGLDVEVGAVAGSRCCDVEGFAGEVSSTRTWAVSTVRPWARAVVVA